MRKAASFLTTSDLKAEARNWRAEQGQAGNSITHSHALEMVARFHGFRDWNTASAVLPATRAPAFAVGQAVKGKYLKQPFTGSITGMSILGGGDLFQVTVEFDEPVDVVTFDSFSAFRHRVVATVNREGVSPAKTGDGIPQMVMDGVT
ncbi:glyoxalase superfamily protein [Pelagibacterium limicola]|uniref:glyoxalase superfamily protein n=1 Tax=Pelagibacterium limicola TaxID=2791022 RepID=UPI0018AFD943|nr:glyoxalase superfamily protein [Pelagibacterium limicola]